MLLPGNASSLLNPVKQGAHWRLARETTGKARVGKRGTKARRPLAPRAPPGWSAGPWGQGQGWSRGRVVPADGNYSESWNAAWGTSLLIHHWEALWELEGGSWAPQDGACTHTSCPPHTRTQIHTGEHMHIHAYVDTSTHSRVLAHPHAHTHAQRYMCTHAHKCTHKGAHICTHPCQASDSPLLLGYLQACGQTQAEGGAWGRGAGAGGSITEQWGGERALTARPLGLDLRNLHPVIDSGNRGPSLNHGLESLSSAGACVLRVWASQMCGV